VNRAKQKNTAAGNI